MARINRLSKAALAIAVSFFLLGCFGIHSSIKIRLAASRVCGYASEYIPEANKAIVAVGHPDAERLVEMGLILQKAIERFETWSKDQRR